MPGRTLDAILMESLGLKEMTICRLLWEIDDLKDTVIGLQAVIRQHIRKNIKVVSNG